jgi:wyosine [tRNA(Phe)-imidazoG37] synthetase (radical SAM superfamily)
MVNNQKSENRKFVFGPVPSRRLGRSLGVDLIPFKTCTFDCVYCQIGRTTHHAVERREFVPMDQVLVHLKDALASGPKPDYITLAGSGEPTLYSRLGDLIDQIHALTDVPVDIITNGSTLWMDDVFEEIVKADLIIPSLDAGDEKTYMDINRSVIEITFEKLLAGLNRLRQTCPEKVWLEVFLIKGLNDSPDHVRKIADLIRPMNFAKVQLNTAVRPPAEKFVQCVSAGDLEKLAGFFTPRAEIIADFPAPKIEGQCQVYADAILDMLRRRPCTLDDIVAGLNVRKHEVIKILDALVKENKIHAQIRQDKEYYLYG